MKEYFKSPKPQIPTSARVAATGLFLTSSYAGDREHSKDIEHPISRSNEDNPKGFEQMMKILFFNSSKLTKNQGKIPV